MDKLEQYVERVCGRLGGPRAMRSHVRRELREHLMDAVAAHVAEGMSEEEAVERALEDFGGPEEVREDLEAEHGHRLMAVILEKAMAWKERTMKARWLWTTWAHVALGLVIVMEVMYVALSMVFIMPKVEHIVASAGVGGRGLDEMVPGASAFLGFVHGMQDFGAVVMLIGSAMMWGFLEWLGRRGENRTLVRLSVMGTVAVLLMGMVFMAGMVTTIPMAMAAPMLMAERPEQNVSMQMGRIDTAMEQLREAMEAKNWEAARIRVGAAVDAMERLAWWGGSAPAIVSSSQQGRVDAVREELESARLALREARNAAVEENRAGIEGAVRRFGEAYGRVKAATRPVR